MAATWGCKYCFLFHCHPLAQISGSATAPIWEHRGSLMWPIGGSGEGRNRTNHKWYLSWDETKILIFLYLTMLNLKNDLPVQFSPINTFQIYDLLIDLYCTGLGIPIILLFMAMAILFCFMRKVCHVTSK